MCEQTWFPGDAVIDVGSAIHEAGDYEGHCETAYFGIGSEQADSGAAHPEHVPAAPADDTGFTAYSTGQAALRCGEIVVTATESGLPMGVHIDPDQLRRDPVDLADDVLRLCRLAANRAGLARRAQLARLGVGEVALDLLGLPTQDAVERAELGDESDYDYEPRSWLDHDGSVW